MANLSISTFRSKPMGLVTISRAMIFAGAIVIGGLAVVTFEQINTISRIKIGGEQYLEISDGKDFLADILPPPLYPLEAFSLAHAVDLDTSKAATLRQQAKVFHQQYNDRLALWEKKASEDGLMKSVITPAFLAQEKSLGEEFWNIYEQSFIPASDKNDSAGTNAALIKLTNNYFRFGEFINQSVGSISDAINIKQNGRLSEANSSQLLLSGLSIGIAIAIGLIFLAAYQLVVRAISRISEAMSSLAAGDLETQIPYGNRTDEVGLMSGAVEVFKRQAVKNFENTKNSEFIISALGDGLENLSNGNLTYRLNAAFPVELEQLRDDFNSAASSLQETITSVKNGTDGIKTGTEEIAQASDDLSRRTENQAANLEETAAAVAEITGAVKKTATGAIHARSVVTAAKNEADKSGEVVRRAVEAMQGIEKSSQKINQIISVIDEIAFQTNLLALNAGVEAARAGDAGRGFAVVASEVRALAQRSADAAKEIKGLLSTSRGQVEDGVHLVAETGVSLKQIIERVTEINNVVAEIAASAEQQASGLQEVNTAVDQMDQVTQQNAAMVEEATAATRTLTQQSGELARVVARFTTAASEAVSRVIESHKPAPRAPIASVVKKKRVANASSGGSSHEGWEEF